MFGCEIDIADAKRGMNPLEKHREMLCCSLGTSRYLFGPIEFSERSLEFDSHSCDFRMSCKLAKLHLERSMPAPSVLSELKLEPL